MKRAAFLFLLFGIIAGGAFAQVTFGGEAFVGIQLETPFSDTNQKETVGLTHRDEGASKLNFFTTASRENYGLKLDLTYQVAAENPVSLNGLYGWARVLDKSMKLTLGQISDGIWVSNLDADHEVTFDEISGLRVDYNVPLLKGLNIGAAFPANGLTDEDFDLEKMPKKVIFGASYVHYLFNAVFAYDLGSNTRMLFGFNFTGIDDLTSAGVQMKVSNMATWEDRVYSGEIQLLEKVGYRIIRPLNVSMLFGQTIFGNPDKDVFLLFNLTTSYRLFPKLTAYVSGEISSPDYFETNTYKVKPGLEFSLGGMGLLYMEYELELAKYKTDSFHRFGIGMEIKAF